jgi:hypothetical protein
MSDIKKGLVILFPKPRNMGLVYQKSIQEYRATFHPQLRNVGFVNQKLIQEYGATSYPKLRNIRFVYQKSIPEYGATSHTARTSVTSLKYLFQHHLNSRSTDVSWQARSPYLTAPDIFMWGFPESNIFQTRPRTTQQPLLQMKPQRK